MNFLAVNVILIDKDGENRIERTERICVNFDYVVGISKEKETGRTILTFSENSRINGFWTLNDRYEDLIFRLSKKEAGK